MCLQRAKMPALTVDRDLQIFSLTLSQLSYQGNSRSRNRQGPTGRPAASGPNRPDARRGKSCKPQDAHPRDGGFGFG